MAAPASQAAVKPALEIRRAEKRFGFVSALQGVDLILWPGEVVALLGDNGAGKSTLVKCLSGVHTLDDGTIEVDGREVLIKDAKSARALGIETVYQDLALFDNLTAAGNFFIGREPTSPAWVGSLGFLRKRAMKERAAQVIRNLRVGLDPDQPTGLMSGGQRQAVAVARAEAFASKIILLDEPTAALGVRESRAVLDLVRRLPERGVSVLLISHNLEHVAAVADRAIVLRQGRNVGEAKPTPENHDLLVSLIVGSVTDRQTSDGERRQSR
jgi:ABC-type sugar transport system ATPase subunit